MVLRFASLGSGSRGNATLIETGATRLLVDCGFAAREFEQRCGRLDFDPASLTAILVTHEHGDHRRGVGAVARRYGVPVWMTHGTYRAADFGRLENLHLFNGHAGDWRIGDVDVAPVPVPHDANEPVQYLFQHAGQCLGMLTDLGSIPPSVLRAYAAADALLLECNHDTGLLAEGPYPPSLRARVGGAYGHLSNAQAAAFLDGMDRNRLSHVVVGHLSEQNNTPSHARRALHGLVDGRLTVLEQDQVSGWFTLGT